MTLEYPAYPGQKRKWCHERRHSDWEPFWINWDFGDMNGYETNSYHYMNHICTPTSCNKRYANQICGCGCIIYRDTLGCSWDIQVSGNPWSKDATMLNKSIQCYMVNKCKQTWQWKLPILGSSSNWWTLLLPWFPVNHWNVPCVQVTTAGPAPKSQGAHRCAGKNNCFLAWESGLRFITQGENVCKLRVWEVFSIAKFFCFAFQVLNRLLVYTGVFVQGTSAYQFMWRCHTEPK